MTESSMKDFSRWSESLRNFDLLGLGGRAMDLDLLVHAYGRDKVNRFLVLEGKQPGERLLTGQRVALSALAAVPNFTVVVVRGTPEGGYFCDGGGWTGRYTLDELKERAEEWWTTSKHGT